MSIRNFSDEEITAYNQLGSDYLSMLEAVRNKYNARLDNYTNLIETIVNSENVSDVPDVTIPYDNTLINARTLYLAINNGDNEVLDFMSRPILVDDVVDSVHDQINSAKATICAYDALGEGQATGGDVMTLLQSKFDGVSIDLTSINVYKSTITSILCNSKLNVYQKAQSLMSYITPTAHSDGYYPVDREFSKKTPFHIFFGDISINYSNFFTYLGSAFVFNFKMEAAICKMAWVTGKNIWNKVSKWWKRNYTEGTRIKLLDQDAYPIADGYGKVEKTPMDTFSTLQSWFNEHLPYGMFLQVNIPGGILLFQRTIALNQYDEEYDELTVMYRPILTNFILELVSKGYCDPTIDNDHTCFRDLFEAVASGDINSDPMDYTPVDLDWSDSATNQTAAKGFAISSWLSFVFLCALSNKDPDYTADLTDFDDWLDYSWTDAADLSAWKNMFCNGTNNSPLNQSNAETANTYTTRIMNFSQYLKFDKGLLGLIFYMSDGTRTYDNWSFTWISRSDYPSPAYHLADTTELGKQAANATTAIIVAIAAIAVTVVIAKKTAKWKDQVRLAQAEIDRDLFDDNLTLAKVRQLRKKQRKVDVSSRLLGLPSTVVSATSGSSLFSYSSNNKLIQQIVDLIK